MCVCVCVCVCERESLCECVLTSRLSRLMVCRRVQLIHLQAGGEEEWRGGRDQREGEEGKGQPIRREEKEKNGNRGKEE